MPIHLKIKPKDLSPYVLLPGDPARTRMIAQNFLDKVRVISDFRGLLSYTGKFRGLPLSIVTTGMGCPSAGIVVEELVNLGAKVLIRVGTCGGVPEKIQPGDLIIPKEAIPLVGLLKNYAIKERITKPHPAILKTLFSTAKRLFAHAWVGKIATTDAFYQEKKEAKNLEPKNILALEMECAGIFALGKLRKVKTGAILTVTGNILYPAPLPGCPDLSGTEVQHPIEQRCGVYGQQVMETREIEKSIKMMCKIALETIFSLINSREGKQCNQ